MEGYAYSAYPCLWFPVILESCTRTQLYNSVLSVQGYSQLESFSEMLYCKEQGLTVTFEVVDVLVVSGAKVARTDV